MVKIRPTANLSDVEPGGQVCAKVYFMVKKQECKKMAVNVRCKKPEHNKHICALKAEGFDKEHPNEFKQLTANPRYICANCRAKVKDKDSVCEPVAL